MQKIINIVIALVAFYLIRIYLIPFLGAFAGIASLLLVIALIIFILKTIGAWFE